MIYDFYALDPASSRNWIMEDQLDHVTTRLLATYMDDKKKLTSKAVASYIQRLISAELKPGGPYSSAHGKKLITNALILQLTKQLGLDLPNVSKYVEDGLTKLSGETLYFEDYWMLIWPKRLTHQEINLVYKNPSSKGSRQLRKLLVTRDLVLVKPRPVNSTEQLVYEQLMGTDEPVRSHSIKIWELIVRADRNEEISMLNNLFSRSLTKKSKLKPSMIKDLDVANFYAWMAYAIYDDFIDNEGKTELLSSANFAHRRSLLFYLGVATNLQLDKDLVLDAYDTVDRSNLIEVLSLRAEVKGNYITVPKFLDYGDGTFLSERAIGHINGLLIIAMSDRSWTKKNLSILKKGLQFYLIARQINDDLSDWSKDLDSGHISYVVAYLLTKLNVDEGTFNLADLKKKVGMYFWKTGLKDLNLLGLAKLQESQSLLFASGIVRKDSAFIKQFLDPMQKSFEQSNLDLIEKREFLEEYTKSTSSNDKNK